MVSGDNICRVPNYLICSGRPEGWNSSELRRGGVSPLNLSCLFFFNYHSQPRRLQVHQAIKQAINGRCFSFLNIYSTLSGYSCGTNLHYRSISRVITNYHIHMRLRPRGLFFLCPSPSLPSLASTRGSDSDASHFYLLAHRDGMLIQCFVSFV